MTFLLTVRGTGSPHTSPSNLWAGPSALSLIYCQGHRKWFYWWVTHAVPQDPSLRRALYWEFNTLPLLVTLWKFFIILSLNHIKSCVTMQCVLGLGGSGPTSHCFPTFRVPGILNHPGTTATLCTHGGLSMGMGRVKVRYVCLTHLGTGRSDGCPHSRWAAPWHVPEVTG